MPFCSHHNEEHDETEFKMTKYNKIDSWCLEGRKEYNREYSKKAYAERKVKVAEEKLARENRTEQECTECRQVKKIDNFGMRSDRIGKRFAKCRECRKSLLIKKTHTSEHRAKGAERQSQKRAIKAKATVGDPKENSAYIDILKNDPCCFCGSKENIEIDHIDPLAPKSNIHGDHDWTNFTAACSRCNNSKDDKKLLQYLMK